MNHDEEEGEIGGPGSSSTDSKSGTASASNSGTPSGLAHHSGPPDSNPNSFRPRFPPSHGRGGGGGGRFFQGIGYRGISRDGSFGGGRGGFQSVGRGGRGGEFRGGGTTNDPPFREEPPLRTDSFSRPGFREGAPTPFRSNDRARSGSVSLNRDGSFGGGPPAPFSREASYSGPPREYSVPFSGSAGGPMVTDREGSFGRDGPPRDGPQRGPALFRRETVGPQPFRRGESQGSFTEAGHSHPRPFGTEHVRRDSNALHQGGPLPPQDPRRPTDPRRRSSQDLGGLVAVTMEYVPSLGPNTGRGMSEPPLPSPQPPPGRRLSSYSSLADSSTMPTSLVPSAEPLDQGFRSPTVRRNAVPEYISSGMVGSSGSTANGATRNPSWSPMPERRSSGPRPEDGAPNPVPPVTSRGPPLFRENSKVAESEFSGPRPPIVASRNRSFGEELDLSSRVQRSNSFSNPRSSPLHTPLPANSFGGGSSGHVSSISVPTALERGASDVASVTLSSCEISVPSATVEPVEKPLLTSSLGVGEIVERAETAVLHLSEVLLDPSIRSDSGLSQLPAKQQIMAAVTQIESHIKLAQSKFDAAQEEHKQGIEEEAHQEERLRKQLEEREAQFKLDEAERLLEEKRLEFQLKAQGLLKIMEHHKEEFDSVRQEFEHSTREMIQSSKKTLKQEYDLEAQICRAQQDCEKDINKARNSMEKAKSSSLKVEAKLAAALAEYETLLAASQRPVDSGDINRTSKQGSQMLSLAESIMAENLRKAEQSHVLAFAMSSENDEAFDTGSGPKDPTYGKSFEEWSVLTKQVTGLGDALFSDPSETPYFQKNEHTHSLLAPSVKEYIRHNQKRLVEEWTLLAEEYEVRKRLYEKQQRKLAKKARSGSVSVSRRSIMAGDSESLPAGVAQGIDRSNILESGSRGSSNPYRRARRGNEVRSEYEQEQIIAEIAAKEAMEKRITHGGCKVPHQLSCLERGITASFVHTFNSHRIDNMRLEAEESQMINIWTDMEKCIFLDRFLQFPKDFRRIATFLRNKTTKDCISFYYNSKQTVPYKAALKEHVMRRKRKGDYSTWDASIQAAISVGATVTAGESEDKPLAFALPHSDQTYRVLDLHPLRRAMLDRMLIDPKAAKMYERDHSEENKVKVKKRARDPLFSLEKHQTKFLRQVSQEQSVEQTTDDDHRMDVEDAGEALLSPVKKTPQKWTAEEKNIFVETLEQHGRDWAKLALAVGTKNEKQIKNFYYDWKKGKSRPIVEKKSKIDKTVKIGKPRKSPGESDEVHHSAAEETIDDSIEPDVAPQRHDSHDELKNQLAIKTELRAQAEAMARELDLRQNHNPSGSTTPEDDYGGNSALMQRLLRQQLQQQHLHQPSALQHLLSQQHLQRESQLNSLSLDDTRMLLGHHQSQPTSVVSNMLGSQWMLQGQGAALTTNAITAALRGESNGLGALSDMGDLQRLVQIQRASQGASFQNQQQSQLASLLLHSELGASANGNLSAVLLQLANSQNGGPVTDPSEHLASLASAHHLLNFGSGSGGGSNLANPFYGMDSSDAFSLLARSLHRNDGSSRAFGLPDGTGRFN